MNVPPHITPSKHLLERCYEKNLDINKVNETLYNPDKIEPHSKSAHKTVHKKKFYRLGGYTIYIISIAHDTNPPEALTVFSNDYDI